MKTEDLCAVFRKAAEFHSATVPTLRDGIASTLHEIDALPAGRLVMDRFKTIAALALAGVEAARREEGK